MDATKERSKLSGKLHKLDEQISELDKKIGSMYRMPRYDSNRSEATLHNWGLDREALIAKRDQAAQELTDLLTSAPYQGQIDAQVAKLAARRNRLQEDLGEIEARLKVWQNETIQAVIDGKVDPVEAASQRAELRLEAEILADAIALVNGGIAKLQK
jgi:chromosome segregation ATPase